MDVVQTNFYSIVFNFDKMDSLDLKKCTKELEEFVDQYFISIRSSIERIDIIHTPKTKVGGTAEFGNTGYVITMEGSEIAHALMSNEKLLKFSEDDIKEARLMQNHFLYHEFQHIKNKIDHKEYYQIMDVKDDFSNVFTRRFLEEYFAYYESQIKFPLVQNCIDEFKAKLAESRGKFKELVKGKKRDEIILLSDGLFYNFASALAYKNANNIIYNQESKLEYDVNQLKDIFEKIEIIMNDYQCDTHSIESVIRFRKSMKNVYGKFLNIICKL